MGGLTVSIKMPGFHDVFLSREFKTIRDDLVKRFVPAGGIQHRQRGYGVFSNGVTRLNPSSINNIGKLIHDSVLYNGIDAGQGTRPVPGVNSLLENSIFKDQFYLLSSEHSLPLIRARTGEAARVEFGVKHTNSGNLVPIKHTSRTMKAPYHEIVRLLDSIRYTQEEIEIVKDRIVEDQGVLFPAVGTSEFPDPKIGDLISPMTKDEELAVEGQYSGHGGKWGIIFIMDFLNKMHASSELYKVFYGSVATKARVTITAHDLVAKVQKFIANDNEPDITGDVDVMLTKWKVTNVWMRQGVSVFTDDQRAAGESHPDIKLHTDDEIFVDLVEGVGSGQIWIRLSDYQEIKPENERWCALMELIKAGKSADEGYSVWVKPITQTGGRADLEEDKKFGQVSRRTVMEERGMRGGADTPRAEGTEAAAAAAEAEAGTDVVAAPGAAPGAAAGPDVVAASAAPVAGAPGAAAIAAEAAPRRRSAAPVFRAAWAAAAAGATAFESPGEETKRMAQERATRFLNSAKFSGLFEILNIVVELLGQHLLRLCKNTNKANSKLRAHGAHGLATALAITGGTLAIAAGPVGWGAMAAGSAMAGTASAGVGTASVMATDKSAGASQAKADAHMQCIYRLMEMISIILVFIPNLNLAAYDDDEEDGTKYKEAKKNLFQHMVRIINLVGTTPEGLLGRDYQMGGWERGAADYFAKCGVEICENPINDMGKKSNALKQQLKSRRGVEQSNLKLRMNTASIEGNRAEILTIKRQMDHNMAGRTSPARSYTSDATDVSEVDDVFRELAGESRYSRQPEPEFEPVPEPAGAPVGSATPGSALQAPTVATTVGDQDPPGDDALGDPDPTSMAATPGAATPGAATPGAATPGSWV